jgi:hypothetical protein
MQIEFLSQFDKDIDNINQKSVRLQIARLLEHVERAENLAGLRNLKKLKGHRSAYRVRSAISGSDFFWKAIRSYLQGPSTEKIFTRYFLRPYPNYPPQWNNPSPPQNYPPQNRSNPDLQLTQKFA